MRHEAKNILDAATAETGWDDNSKLSLLLEYIDKQDDPDTFYDFISRKAEEELNQL